MLMIIGQAFFLHLWLLDLQPIRLGNHLLLVGSRSTRIYASFAYGNSQSSFIFRNHKGSILWASSHSHHCLNSLIAEALALHDACKFINQLKIKDAIFESDSFNAITFYHQQCVKWGPSNYSRYWRNRKISEHMVKMEVQIH